jgi:hypothetical protein
VYRLGGRNLKREAPDAKGVDSLDPELVENVEFFPLGDEAASLQKDLVADDDEVAVALLAVLARIHKACGQVDASQ